MDLKQMFFKPREPDGSTTEGRIRQARETLARCDMMINRCNGLGAAAARQGNVDFARAMDEQLTNLKQQRAIVQRGVYELMEGVGGP